MKKCPVCNSTRIVESSNGLCCKRCGYIHKKNSTVNRDLENLSK